MRLHEIARLTLWSYRIRPEDWAQEWFGTDSWQGDQCGCPHSRCMDYHHVQPTLDCWCLTQLLADHADLVRGAEDARARKRALRPEPRRDKPWTCPGCGQEFPEAAVMHPHVLGCQPITEG